MTNKRLTLCVVTALIATGLSAPPAQAAVTVTLLQEGSFVVAAGSGTINTADLNLEGSFDGVPPRIAPDDAVLSISTSAMEDVYRGIAGPKTFGSGPNAFAAASSAVGDLLGVFGGTGSLFLPGNYVSGSALKSSSTWPNDTLSSLGVTPGIYIWRWGSGTNADSFTLKAGATTSAVPEPATLALLGLGLVGLGLCRRRLAHC